MITAGLEDYIEYIYSEIEKGINLKAIDIANYFNISRASVSEALIRLSDKDLIIYEGRKGIKITKKGISEAKKIFKKHKILSEFFDKVLGIDSDISSKNACKIEHVIDKEVIEKIDSFTVYCINHNINNKFKGKK